jgi:UDP-N-acetylmuramate--alanine ligase
METCNIKTAGVFEQLNTGSISGLKGLRFHFIGAGGIGMSGLAKVLIRNKAIVSGSDMEVTEVTTELCRIGADIKSGHNAENLKEETDAVVISAAIKENNPELKAARERGCEIFKYAELLGGLMNCYDGIAISGTHGKSTTSSWLTYCLKEAGLEPSFIVGAKISQLDSSSGVGDGKYFIAESCEYDRSFLNLKPKIAAILNIEQDHLDYYKDEDEIVEAFREFAGGVKPGGVVIASGEDANTGRIIAEAGGERRFETFGFDESCNFSAQNIRLIDGLYSFDVYHNGEPVGTTQIAVPGRHNILNGLAVFGMGVNAGVEGVQMLDILGEFTGIDRRLMLKGRFKGVTVLDDYAHHPTEIRASLCAIRERYEPKRLWCIFQPHQYSRTRFLLDDFAESFKLADVTIVPEIYFVRDTEAEKRQINSEILVERIRGNGADAKFIDGFESICDYLKENVREGELVVSMGAGDIWKVSDEYIQRLRENC